MAKKIGRVPSPLDLETWQNNYYSNPMFGSNYFGSNYPANSVTVLDANNPVINGTITANGNDTTRNQTACNCLYGNPVIDINGNCSCQNAARVTVTAGNTAKNETIILPQTANAPVTIIEKLKQNPLLAGGLILAAILLLKD